MHKTLRRLYFSFQQNKAVNMLNILGLSIGIGVAMLIYFWIANEISFDRDFEDASQIYRVLQERKDQSIQTLTSTALGQELQQNYPQIENTTCVFRVKNGKPSSFKYGEHIGAFHAITTDKNFFKVFDFVSVYHSDSIHFSAHNAVVLSTECAKKMFGDANPIGKQIENIFYQNETYVVSDVVKRPQNTHLYFDIVTSKDINHSFKSYWDKWNVNEGVTYIKLAKNCELSNKQKIELKHFLTKRHHSENKLLFQPLKDIHLFSAFNDPFNYRKGHHKYVRIFLIFCVLLLVVAALNYVMIANSLSEKRNKEIALKKLYGAKKTQIIWHIFVETLVFVLLAQCIALFIFFVVSMLWNNAFITYFIQSLYNFKYLLFLVSSTLIISSISSAYISYYTNLKTVIATLKGKIIYHGKSLNLSHILYPLQLIVAFSFIIFAVSVYSQLQYMYNKDTGINTKNMVSIDTQGVIYKLDDIKKRLIANPNIYHVTAVGGNPIDYHFERAVDWQSKTNKEKTYMGVLNIDPDFLETFDIQLLQGNPLPKNMNVDDFFAGTYINHTPIIVNETACKKMGLKNPIGTTINLGYAQAKGYIVGVVSDFNFKPLSESISPLAMMYNPENFTELVVEINPKKKTETLAFIKEVIADYQTQTYNFDYYFIDDSKASIYQKDIEMMRIIMLFAAITFIIAFFGVISSITYDISGKRKAIAIHKILGASSGIVIRNYMRKTGLKVALSFIIAILISYPYTLNWLNQFAYKMNMPYMIFALICIAAVIALSLLSVPLVFAEANKNPTENIKYE